MLLLLCDLSVSSKDRWHLVGYKIASSQDDWREPLHFPARLM